MSASTINRLKRSEGQIRGIIKMLEEGRYCIDILQQMQAVKAALARAESQLLMEHAQTCIEDAIASGNAAAQREKVVELIDLFDKLKR
ncbi:MAG: metal-sensitive transcriptional regulator [Litorimonas sp.]|nr:metal-sensitive transcriptional regulator [Algimonas ampicilliniresistens]